MIHSNFSTQATEKKLRGLKKKLKEVKKLKEKLANGEKLEKNQVTDPLVSVDQKNKYLKWSLLSKLVREFLEKTRELLFLLYSDGKGEAGNVSGR